MDRWGPGRVISTTFGFHKQATGGKATVGFKVTSPKDEYSSTTYLDPLKTPSYVQEPGKATSMTWLVGRDKVPMGRMQGWECINN